MYEDDLVCILKPEVKKGYIIYSDFNQPSDSASLCEVGLKHGKLLKKQSIYFGRQKIHPYIFFRAPYYSRVIDYSTPETEILSLYGDILNPPYDPKHKTFIRVDPDRTYVFASEIRVHFSDDEIQAKLESSKKTLTKYLEVIEQNEQKKFFYPKYWNLLTGEEHKGNKPPNKIFSDAPIERNSEILVSLPHLTKDYFVKCNP